MHQVVAHGGQARTVKGNTIPEVPLFRSFFATTAAIAMAAGLLVGATAPAYAEQNDIIEQAGGSRQDDLDCKKGESPNSAGTKCVPKKTPTKGIDKITGDKTPNDNPPPPVETGTRTCVIDGKVFNENSGGGQQCFAIEKEKEQRIIELDNDITFSYACSSNSPTIGEWYAESTGGGNVQGVIWRNYINQYESAMREDGYCIITVYTTPPPTASLSNGIGQMTFRFYGTATNPTAAYTVSMTNFAGEGVDGNSVSVGRKPTSPSDSSGNARAPWSVNAPALTRENKKALNDSFDGTSGNDVAAAYKINNSKEIVYTDGAPFAQVGQSCSAYSQPAAYQAGGTVNGFPEELANSTVSSSGVVNYNSAGGLFSSIEAWADRAWNNSLGNDSFKARLLGLSGNNTELNMGTISSAQYVACGSPINFPTYIPESNVLERNDEGWPTRVTLPGLGEVKTTASATIGIAKGCSQVGVKTNDCFAEVLHADKDKELIDAAYFDPEELDNGKNDDKGFRKLDVLYGTGTQDGVVSKIRAELRNFYGTNAYKNLYPGKLNSQFKKFTSGVKSQVVVEDISPNQLANGTAITLNPGFISLDPNLLPTLEEVGAPSEVTTPPTTEQPEEAPPVPNAPPQNTPNPAGFVWSVEAKTTPYLEVKAAQGAANTFDFRASIESEWRSQASAEAFIDDLGRQATTGAFNDAKGAWNSFSSQVSGTPGVGLAAAQLTTEKRATFAGRDWDLKAVFEGMDTKTYIPQCNTGQTQGIGCSPEGSNWNQAPAINSSCTSPACYEPGQVVNNATRGGEGIAANGVLPYTNYRVGGPGIKMGAWSYDFYKATAKDKAVYLTHESPIPVDIDVRYDANNPSAVSWNVNGRYKTWDPIYGPPYSIFKPCTVWEFYSPDKFNEAGQRLSYPVADECYAGTRRDIIGYQPSGWKGWGRGGSYTQYTLADNLSGVATDPVTGRAIRSETFGGAECDNRTSTAWNYCSPVLAGKVVR